MHLLWLIGRLFTVTYFSMGLQMSIIEFDGPPSWSLDTFKMPMGRGGYSKAFTLITPPPVLKGICTPQFRSHQETQDGTSQTHGSTTMISCKNRGLWTVLFFVQGTSTTVPQKKDDMFLWPKFIYNNLKFYHLFSHNFFRILDKKEFLFLINKLKVVWSDTGSTYKTSNQCTLLAV